MKEVDVSSLEHTSWRCQYHVVFAPKYRRMEIYGKIKEDIGIILRKLCQQKSVEIIEAQACPDHIHMLISIPPKYSVSQIMGYLKGKSSLMIFDRHANLKYKYGNRHFWARGYFVDTVGRNKKAIKAYIIYDTQPNTRVVATGSASPALMKGSRESGAGRWTVIQVPTMSFYEYCELLNLDRPNIASDLKVTTLLHKSQIERTQIMMQLSKVQNHFMRYLQVGGFPELALADNDLMAQQIMREDVVDKVLKRDLPSLYNIRNATELERIFLYLCNVSSEIVSIEAITKELNGVSRTTVENYIQYLESANLIYQSWPVDMAGKKVLKARPKIYIADAAIRNAVLMDDSVLTDPVEMGKIVETAVYKHAAAFYYQYATSVGYFRGGKKGKEIDIVVDYPNTKNILIEVKYREGAPIADDDAIVELCEESSAAIIITKNADDYGVHNTKCGKDLLRIPAFAFLYLLGNAEKHGYRGMEQ